MKIQINIVNNLSKDSVELIVIPTIGIGITKGLINIVFMWLSVGVEIEIIKNHD